VNNLLLEVLVIGLMIVLNAFFACSEFAIVSVRKSRISRLVDEGDERARIIEELQQDPHRLLALVQIGVTVTGATASTIGGIIAVDNLRPWLQKMDMDILRLGAEPVAITSMVIIISYLLLILGELVPKAIGLQYSDAIALWVARPINALSRFGTVFVGILVFSSKAVLRLLRISGEANRRDASHRRCAGGASALHARSAHAGDASARSASAHAAWRRGC